MKWIIITIASIGVIGLGFIAQHPKHSKKSAPLAKVKAITGAYSPVAILELFTSEGCSSCPSADNLLPQLAKIDSTVIPLSFHVDYWNRLGWTDPFSNSQFSERQRDYATQLNLESVYTPQLIVNGTYEFVGSNRSKAESAIGKVLKEKATVKLEVDEVRKRDNKLLFSIYAEGDIAKSKLLAVIVQKQVTMNVKAGENSGAKLTHTNVVRTFDMQTAKSKNEFSLSIPNDITDNQWELIVYTQQENKLKITGALKYTPTK